MPKLSDEDLHPEDNDEHESNKPRKMDVSRTLPENSCIDRQYGDPHIKRQRHSPGKDVCQSEVKDERNRLSGVPSVDKPAELSSSFFPGLVQPNNAVSVRGNDGLMHYGLLVHKDRDGFLIDFKCGPNRMRVVPFGAVYRLKGLFTVWDKEYRQWESEISTAVKDKDQVEVLLQMELDGPWKWYPGALITADSEKGYFGHVSVFFPTGQTTIVVVPGQQIRLRSSEAELTQSLVQSTDSVDWLVHYPLPLDFEVNWLPFPLLAEVLERLLAEETARARRVCSLWNNIILTNAATIINVRFPFNNPVYWHSLWTDKTRVIVMDVDTDSEFRYAKECATLLKRMMDEYGCPPLLGVGLRRMRVTSDCSDAFCKELESLRDTLTVFAPTCRFIRLFNEDLFCHDSRRRHQCTTTLRGTWIDTSERGFGQRFARSLSVNSVHGKDEVVQPWIDRQIVGFRSNGTGDDVKTQADRMATSPQNCRVSNGPVAVTVKHSRMPFGSFKRSIYAPRACAVRGDDGSLHHALVIAKETTGLLVDFCNRQPFEFVPFGKVYSYPTSGLFGNPGMNDSVEVLLQLNPDGPWKWFPATVIYSMQIYRHYSKMDSQCGFVRVFVGNGETVVTMVLSKQLRCHGSSDELERNLWRNWYYFVEAEERRIRPLPDETRIRQLPFDMFREVLGHLRTAACFKMRSVCRLWDRLVSATTFSIIHLRFNAGGNVACLNNVWSARVTTVVLEGMRDYFGSMCRLVKLMVLQNGGRPLKLMVLQADNQLKLHYDYTVGVCDDILFLASFCQCIVFRNASSCLRIIGKYHTAKAAVRFRTGRTDLAERDHAAKLWTMVAKNVQIEERMMKTIRSFFSADRISRLPHENVVRILKILNDIENVMCGEGDSRRKQWSAETLMALNPKKLNGIAVVALAHWIEREPRVL